ncbi:MAG: hypothetical protein M5U11_10835 [Anaerolineales bacterium]|nr:hypothetical protein [Anaerolineales bacterium]MDX9936439.1 hypothetical protein [Anaerolineales bacterium]
MSDSRQSAPARSGKRPSRPAAKRKAKKPPVCRAPRFGGRCPQCKKGRLDYDGLLILHCPLCGYSAGGGGFT